VAWKFGKTILVPSSERSVREQRNFAILLSHSQTRLLAIIM
jgi:hypothetical protein